MIITKEYPFYNWVQQSSSRIKTADFYNYDGFSSITVYIEGNPNLQYDFVGLDSNGNQVVDIYWYNSGITINIPTNTTMTKWYLWGRYSNNGNITPDAVTACKGVASAKYDWLINDGDYPFLESLPQNLTVMNEPYSITLMTQKANEYPKYDNLELKEIASDYPIILMTQKANEYPKYDNLKLLKFNSPYPIIIMIQKNNEYPFFEQLKLESLGAFKDAINLQSVIIPKSVKKIGPYSFANTKLTSITIARDCEYYPTSFPSGCQINFYEE